MRFGVSAAREKSRPDKVFFDLLSSKSDGRTFASIVPRSSGFYQDARAEVAGIAHY
jgi:hypothetical protein